MESLSQEAAGEGLMGGELEVLDEEDSCTSTNSGSRGGGEGFQCRSGGGGSAEVWGRLD